MTAQISGTVEVAGSTADVVLDVAWDAAGQMERIDGVIDLDLVGTMSDGKPSHLVGTLTFGGSGVEIDATFDFSGNIGDMEVYQMTGSAHIDGQVLELDGTLEAHYQGTDMTLVGDVLWDGTNVSTPWLHASGSGTFVSTTPDGRVQTISGSGDIYVVDNITHSYLDGSIRLSGLSGSGEIYVKTVGDQHDIIFNGHVDLGGYWAYMGGTATIRNGELIALDMSGNFGQHIIFGDIWMNNGVFWVRKEGSSIVVKANADFYGPHIDYLGGEMIFRINGTTGDLYQVSGTLAGTLRVSHWLGINAWVSVNADQWTTTVHGSIHVNAFNIIGANFNGTLTIRNATGDWYFDGSGTASIGGFTILNAHFRITPIDGMRGIRLGLFFTVLFIPKWVEMDIYFNWWGGCSRAVVVGGSLLGQFDAYLLLGPVLGCPVH